MNTENTPSPKDSADSGAVKGRIQRLVRLDSILRDSESFAEHLIKIGMIKSEAWRDPDGYDRGTMMDRVLELFDLIYDEVNTLAGQRDSAMEVIESIAGYHHELFDEKTPWQMRAEAERFIRDSHDHKWKDGALIEHQAKKQSWRLQLCACGETRVKPGSLLPLPNVCDKTRPSNPND